MKKLITIICLLCISITGYTQRKETKAFVTEKRAALNTMSVSETSAKEYENLISIIERYSRSLSKQGGNGIPVQFIWEYMPKKEERVLRPLYIAARDSLYKRYAYDREIEKLEKIRLQHRAILSDKLKRKNTNASKTL